MMQQTLDGELITLERVEALRPTDRPPIHYFLVEFRMLDGSETWERVRIEDRIREGMSPENRAILAAHHQSPHDDLESEKVTRFDEAVGASTDEWRVREVLPK